jgi:hypothetical protein
VVSFTHLPLYARYPFNRRLGEPQSRSGRCGEVNIFYPTGTRTPTPPPGRPARSQSLYRLSYPGNVNWRHALCQRIQHIRSSNEKPCPGTLYTRGNIMSRLNNNKLNRTLINSKSRLCSSVHNLELTGRVQHSEVSYTDVNPIILSNLRRKCEPGIFWLHLQVSLLHM